MRTSMLATLVGAALLATGPFPTDTFVSGRKKRVQRTGPRNKSKEAARRLKKLEQKQGDSK